MNIWSPISTYFELTVKEPCKALHWAHRERHRHEVKTKRFSWLRHLRRRRDSETPEYCSAPPLVLGSSLRDQYLSDWL